MGCANSKQSKCRHCQSPYTPIPRSYSMHIHHPPERKGDSYHVVALTSTTLGSMRIDSSTTSDRNVNINGGTIGQEDDNINIYKRINERSKEFSMGVIEAKTWSNMIDEKIPKIVPKTPIRTPPGEPETINTWELMEGLEDTSPLRSDFDPEVISSFRKSFEQLSPSNPYYIRPSTAEITDTKKVNGVSQEYKCASFAKEKVVVYFTSLRGVRRTYEDCCHVRVILKGLGVRMDEKDVSMHSGFKDELKELLVEQRFNGAGLPKVFIGKKYVGGAEEIRRMHEDGQLEKVLDGCEMVDDGGGGDGFGGSVCEGCGDIRFVPCETCSGSCKIYYEGDEDEGEESGIEEGEYGFQRCPDCNENGLIRCPICCY